jgi:hypothetical protein
MAMTARADLLTNGNFNTGDLTGWWTWLPVPANQSFTVEPIGSFDGSPDGLFQNSGSGPQANMNVGQGKFAGAIPGNTYTANCMFKEAIATTGDGWVGANFDVEFYDAANNWLSGTYWNFWATGAWTPYSVSAVAPVGASSVQMKVESWLGGTPDESTATLTLNLDNVTLTGELIPEPATMVLLGIGGLVALRRKHA